jgi:uncharacterized protein (TIGR02271 family)
MLTRDEMVSGRGISPDATQADLQRLTDYEVIDSDFEHIGKATAIWVDRTAQVGFVGVQTSWLSGKTHVVPAQGATVNDRDKKIRLAYLKSDIKSAPVFDPKVELNFANESEIVSYFRKKGPPLPELKGVYPSATFMSVTAAAGSAAAAAAPPSLEQRERVPREGTPREELKEANIQLHEEQLKVSKREVGAGMIRLHKVVRTEHVQQGVDLRHEEIVVERIPAKDLKVGLKAFQDEEFYIPLRQEEAVIEKEARVREQFHAHKAAKMEHKTVSEDCRKEDIEVINQEELRPDLRSDQRARR